MGVKGGGGEGGLAASYARERYRKRHREKGVSIKTFINMYTEPARTLVVLLENNIDGAMLCHRSARRVANCSASH